MQKRGAALDGFCGADPFPPLTFSARSAMHTEAYRSGHNEAVLKTVWVQAHGGSNPSASATAKKCEPRKVARIFFVAAEAEKRDEPLRHKFISSKDRFPSYASIKVCTNDMLPQGSAACEARRFRLFLRLIKGTKFAKMLCLFGASSLWRTSLRLRQQNPTL